MKNRKKFTTWGKTATAQQWADTLGVHRNEFTDAVYCLERLGATREQAVEGSVRYLTLGPRGPKPGVLLEIFNKVTQTQTNEI